MLPPQRRFTSSLAAHKLWNNSLPSFVFLLSNSLNSFKVGREYQVTAKSKLTSSFFLSSFTLNIFSVVFSEFFFIYVQFISPLTS